MLKVGEKVVVINVPPNNDEHWNIPRDYIGLTATVYDISEGYIRLQFGGPVGRWNFPLEYKGVLQPIAKNKWNPTNYVPRFEPLKLP